MTCGVIICAYTEGRWELLERAIESSVAQSVDHHLVLVVDHNDALLARATERWPDITVVPNRYEQGLSGARNTGVETVRGDAIAFLDDDAAAEPGWLAELIAPLTDPEVGITGGHVIPDWNGDSPAWFPDEFLWVVGCSYVGLPTESAPIRNPIGASMAIRRDVFQAVGGFFDGVGRVGTLPMGCEETELSIRARSAGFGAMLQPSSVVRHRVSPDRHTLRYFLRRCRAEGQSKAIVAAVTDTGAALSSERSYVARTLPMGVLSRARRALTGPDRTGALAGIGAIVLGLAATATGFALGSWSRRRSGDIVIDPVRLDLDSDARIG